MTTAITGGLGARIDSAFVQGFTKITGQPLGRYQTAVVRIGFSFTWLLFLLREFPHRHELYGPDSPWSWGLAEQLIEDNRSFTVLMWSEGTGWFETVYLLAIAASAGLLLGWRTRTMSVLFMVGVLAMQNRSVFMGDGGDNVIHLMAMYLVLTRCGQVWSLDARRARRTAADQERDVTGIVLWTLTGVALAVATALAPLTWLDDQGGPLPWLGWAPVLWGLWAVYGGWWALRRHAPGSELRAVCDALANLVHNSALLVIIVEVCLIYATAGWYKVQGSRWQDGTAVYYPMHLDYFAPWPALSDVLGSSGLIILVLSYGTVIVQVAFPFTLFNRRVKNALLVVMILEHASIAVILGLPFFSLAMIAADAVFLPTVFLVWLGARTSGLARRLRPRGRAPEALRTFPEQRSPAPAEAPEQVPQR
jgi:hypothetical protein